VRICYLSTIEADGRLIRALKELGHVVESRFGDDLSTDGLADGPDCVILDLSAPSPIWAARLAAVHPGAFHIQIVTREDRAAGAKALRAGADAWFARPLQIREIGAKLEGAARRLGADGTGAPFRLSGQEQRLYILGEPVPLTRSEYLIVDLLARHPGQVLTAEEISERLWPEEGGRNPASTRACVSRLVSKVERAHGWRLILSERGRGYRLAASPTK
jgi:DNA-binding response OmpR family regulator